MPLTNLQNITAGLFTAFAFESVTVPNSATPLGSGTYTNSTTGEVATRAVITVESGQCRYRYDGGNPTASVGHILNVNNSLVLLGSDNIRNFRARRTGSTSAVLRVTYES